MKRRITESLDVDLDRLEWCCHHCGHSLGAARENYKKGCLLAERSPHEIWRPLVEEKYSFSYDPGWARIVEFYCPGCAVLMDVEMLPPGHPITHDIELDLDALRARTLAESPARTSGAPGGGSGGIGGAQAASAAEHRTGPRSPK